MLANIEIKARARAPDRQRGIAATLSGTAGRELRQTDTYFNVPCGRLKLRESGGPAELIYYQRSDQTGPKRSDYLPIPIADAAAMKTLLTAALGVRGVVCKTRSLFLVDNTRIHIDLVAHRGWFIELEVMLSPGQTDEQGRAVATELMKKLEIDNRDLIAESYIDLLCGPAGTNDRP
ncbi:MAG TPA: class IV adenylate cyclase [Phycisphaerae bacterium]|nr:class IV adenylate cyclase [Phycisphaerae bacterium]